MMSQPTDSPQVLLTSGDVQALADEVGRLSAEIAEIDARRKEIEARRDQMAARIDKIRELMAALGLEDRLSAALQEAHSAKIEAPDTGPSDADDEVRSPWNAAVIEGLRSGPYESLTSSGLRAYIEAGPLANMLKVSDKGYYHAIRRLALRGDITKEYGRLFTKDGLARYGEDGCPHLHDMDEPRNARKSPMADEIAAFLRANGGVARARDIVSHLLTVPQFSGPVGRNKSSAYNVLARLVSRKQLNREEGGSYRLPETNKAPAHAEASNNPSPTEDQTCTD